MAGEYKHTVAKGQVTGFAESPEQEIGNAGSSFLDRATSLRETAGVGIAIMYGKKVAGTGLRAVIDQFGNSRLEEGVAIGTKILQYGTIALVGTPLLAVAAGVAEGATIGIGLAVEGHAINLQNTRTVSERGTRRENNGGGFYG